MRVCACVCVTQAEAQFLLMKRKAEMEQRAKEAADRDLNIICEGAHKIGSEESAEAEPTADGVESGDEDECRCWTALAYA